MIPSIALVGCRSTGILIDVPDAGALGVVVCPATTCWSALLAVMIWPSTVRVNRFWAGILIRPPDIVTAGAPRVMVFPATTYWSVLFGGDDLAIDHESG